MVDVKRARQRGLTIEYSLVLMVLVAAYVVLLLTLANFSDKKFVSYKNYLERKAFLDDVGAVYVDSQGQKNCLDAFDDNKYGFYFEYDTSYLLVRLQSADVELHIKLADTDGDGAKEVVLYRYGV